MKAGDTEQDKGQIQAVQDAAEVPLEVNTPAGDASLNLQPSVDEACSQKQVKPAKTGEAMLVLSDECYASAEEHLKEKLVAHGQRSLWRTVAHDFSEWGTGVQLYFEFTYHFALVCVIVALIHLPIFIFSVSGNATEKLSKTAIGHSQEMLLLTTVANMGTQTMINFNQSSNASSAQAQVSMGREVDIFGNGCDIRNMMLMAGCLDAVAALAILVFCWHFEFIHIPQVVNKHRDELVTPDLYTVYVEHLPRNLPGWDYEHRLKFHFELIMAALIHPQIMVVGRKVLSTKDEGLAYEDIPHESVCCCCLRRAGCDRKGRRIGRIAKVDSTSCTVQWNGTPNDPHPPSTQHEAEQHDLLDASLLWRLETHGVDRVPLPNSQEDIQTDPLRTTTVSPALQESAVYNVYLQRDFGKQLAIMKKEAKKDDRSLEKDARKKHLLRGGSAQRLRNSAGTIANWLLRTPTQEDLEIKMQDRDVIGAFVVFEHTRHRDFIVREYRFSRTLLRRFVRGGEFAGHDIKVTEAQAPSDVFWLNLDFPGFEKKMRSFVVFVACLTLLSVLVFVISFARFSAEDANDDAYDVSACTGGTGDHPDCICISTGEKDILLDNPSGIYDQCKTWVGKMIRAKLWGGASVLVAIVAIFAGGFIVEGLSRVALRPKSLTSLNDKIMCATTIVYVCALGLVRLLNNAELPGRIGLFGSGDYSEAEPEWYLYVGSSILCTLVLNSVYPIVGFFQGPMYWLWIRLRKKRQYLMTDLLDLYTPPEFPIALRHAEQLSTQFGMVFFCAGMPILALLLPLNLFIFYWSDKYSFLRASKTPPRYSHTLMIRQIKGLQFIVMFHCAYCVWVYSDDEAAPSHCLQCDPDDQILGIYTSSKRKPTTPVIPRLFMVSVLPNALLGLVIFGSFAVRITVFCLGHNPLSKAVLQHGVDRVAPHINHKRLMKVRSDINRDDAFHNEVRAMQRKGITCSYAIEDQPGYEFLKSQTCMKTKFERMGLGLQGLDTSASLASEKSKAETLSALNDSESSATALEQLQTDSANSVYMQESTAAGSITLDAAATALQKFSSTGTVADSKKKSKHVTIGKTWIPSLSDDIMTSADSPNVENAPTSVKSDGQFIIWDEALATEESPTSRFPSTASKAVSFANGVSTRSIPGRPKSTRLVDRYNSNSSIQPSPGATTVRDNSVWRRSNSLGGSPKAKGKSKGAGKGKGKGKLKEPTEQPSVETQRDSVETPSVVDEVHEDALAQARLNHGIDDSFQRSASTKTLSSDYPHLGLGLEDEAKSPSARQKRKGKGKGKGKGKSKGKAKRPSHSAPPGQTQHNFHVDDDQFALTSSSTELPGGDLSSFQAAKSLGDEPLSFDDDHSARTSPSTKLLGSDSSPFQVAKSLGDEPLSLKERLKRKGKGKGASTRSASAAALLPDASVARKLQQQKLRVAASPAPVAFYDGFSDIV